MSPPATTQYVCTACGYNLIDGPLDNCPFCGSGRARQLSEAEVQRRYHVVEAPVAPGLWCLNSEPRLGIEHACYRLAAEGGTVWIDSPSMFDPDLAPMAAILFTHKDFLGSCNRYRETFGAEVRLHAADAAHPLAGPFPIDDKFTSDFTAYGVRAHPIGGHSPGFTVFAFDESLFVCDLVFDRGARTRFNPYGEGLRAARESGKRLQAWLDGPERETAFQRVCGWNYVSDYAGWRTRFDALVERGRAVDRPVVLEGERSPERRRYLCNRCGLVYDPLLGMPEDGIAPGTPFAAIPDDWLCPDCNVTKADFVPL